MTKRISRLSFQAHTERVRYSTFDSRRCFRAGATLPYLSVILHYSLSIKQGLRASQPESTPTSAQSLSQPWRTTSGETIAEVAVVTTTRVSGGTEVSRTVPIPTATPRGHKLTITPEQQMMTITTSAVPADVSMLLPT